MKAEIKFLRISGTYVDYEGNLNVMKKLSRLHSEAWNSRKITKLIGEPMLSNASLKNFIPIAPLQTYQQMDEDL
jgi:hypothetical protein